MTEDRTEEKVQEEVQEEVETEAEEKAEGEVQIEAEEMAYPVVGGRSPIQASSEFRNQKPECRVGGLEQTGRRKPGHFGF